MNQKVTMKKLAKDERPYEKCERYGPQSLTDAELIAVLLRSGTRDENALDLARRLLYYSGEDGLLGLHRFTAAKLRKIKGIGPVKTVQLLCLSELAGRLARETNGNRLKFDTPDKVASFYMEELRHKKQENVKLLLLNSKSYLITEKDMSKGTVNASVITPRELLIEALAADAVSMILLHNHPSGDPSPSEEDICLTERVMKAGAIVGIYLVDHIIIGDQCYYSFSEQSHLYGEDS